MTTTHRWITRTIRFLCRLTKRGLWTRQLVTVRETNKHFVPSLYLLYIAKLGGGYGYLWIWMQYLHPKWSSFTCNYPPKYFSFYVSQHWRQKEITLQLLLSGFMLWERIILKNDRTVWSYRSSAEKINELIFCSEATKPKNRMKSLFKCFSYTHWCINPKM